MYEFLCAPRAPKIEVLVHRLKTGVTLDCAAEEAGLSVSRARHLVKDHTGQAPREITRMAGLKKARYLLSTSDMPIKEVAYRIGIHTNTFCGYYRKEFGETPMTTRKKGVNV